MQNSLPTIDRKANQYAAAVHSALGFHSQEGLQLNLGTVAVNRSSLAVAAIIDRRREYVRHLNLTLGQSLPVPLPYSTYLHIVGDYAKQRHAFRREHNERGFVRAPDDYEPPIKGSLLSVFNPDRHTPDSEGFARYLRDVDDALGAFAEGEIAVPLPAADRKRGTYILASPGSGKSELLKLLIYHHVTGSDDAVVVIDPRSDFSNQVARWPELANGERLVFIRPGEFEGMTATLNPLEPPRGADEVTKEKIANRLGQVLNEITRGEQGGLTVRMESLSKACVRLMLDVEGATLWDLYSLLGEAPPPELVKRGKSHPARAVSIFFNGDFEAKDYNASKVALRGRLYNLLSVRDFEIMTCGPSTILLGELVDAGKVVVFSLGGAGKVAAQVLGKLAVGLLASLGDLREKEQRTDRRPVHIILDEGDEFVGEATKEIPSKLRQYGLHLTVAHQYLAQLPQEHRDAMLSNSEIKLLGKTDYAPRVLESMGINDDEGRNRARNLQPRQFMVRWGPRPAFMLTTRGELAGDSHCVKPQEWLAARERQKAFYRAVDMKALPSPENAPEVPEKGPSRGLW